MRQGKGRPGITIFCINDGNVFSSLLEAAEYYKISQASMSRQLRGERKTVGGLHFVKIDDNLSSEALNEIQQKKLKEIFNIG